MSGSSEGVGTAGGPANVRRTPILREGETCWRIADAARVAVLIDGAAYFRALRESFGQARERITIVGWDFDPRIRLDPEEPLTELRTLLPALVERRPELEVRVLVWDVAPLFGPSRATGPLLDRGWHAHPRIHYRFDGHHPPGASHHEKIVCVDDVVAFVGGIDLTVNRWDLPGHAAQDPRRTSPSGEPCPPVHDVQLAFDGEASRAIAELTRRRWRDSGGRELPPCRGGAEVWPQSAAVWLEDARLGIARTRPRLGDQEAVAEIDALNDAALPAARSCVYIEAQYLCAGPVAERLAALLERDDAPEVVLLIWHETTGWLERVAMGSNRDRVLARLAAADRHGRLRAFRLMAAGAEEQEVKVHAKVLIVDDRLLRIGSSNLNNRSRGVDTECDVAVEAQSAAARAAIEALRTQLLAEHLHRPPAEVCRLVEARGVIGAIEALDPGGAYLRPYELGAVRSADPAPGTSLLDPGEPLDLDYIARVVRGQLPG